MPTVRTMCFQPPLTSQVIAAAPEPVCPFPALLGSFSHVGLQPFETVHPLHVALDGGGARDGRAALCEEPAPLSIPQPLSLIPP